MHGPLKVNNISLLHVAVTVTNIRQTFQHMDMTCSVLTVWDTILFTFAV